MAPAPGGARVINYIHVRGRARVINYIHVRGGGPFRQLGTDGRVRERYAPVQEEPLPISCPPKGASRLLQRPCTRPRSEFLVCTTRASSDPATLRHPELSTYGCFLPDLTRFVVLRRAGPDHQRRFAKAVPGETTPQTGIEPRWSGLRVTGHR